MALLVGGYHGGWVPFGERAPHTAPLPHSRSALAPWGADPVPASSSPALARVRAAGGGRRRPLPRGADRRAVRAVRQRPAHLAEHLEALADAGAAEPSRPHSGEGLARRIEELHRVAGLVDGRGACHHPSGSVRLVRSTLMTFADDVQAHLAAAAGPGGA